MQKVIMIGCDLHDKNMLLKIAVNREPSIQKVVSNTAGERARMIKELKAMAEKKKATEIVFAYEASGLGYQLHDELKAGGVDCRVLALTKLPGVGIFTAVTFLTEMGDLKRFNNRRQVASYAGLSPSSNESGLIDNRKGHITRQGPPRLRRVLCQAVWARMRSDPQEKECYEKLKVKNPGKSKIGIVAVMRRLTIKMWHVAKDAAA